MRRFRRSYIFKERHDYPHRIFYSILLVLLQSEFGRLDLMKEEYRWLVDLRIRIMQSVSRLPPAIESLVLEDGESVKAGEQAIERRILRK